MTVTPTSTPTSPLPTSPLPTSPLPTSPLPASPTPTQPPVAVTTTAEPEPSQLASEANAALALLACLLGLVLGTEVLVALLGAIA